MNCSTVLSSFTTVHFQGNFSKGYRESSSQSHRSDEPPRRFSDLRIPARLFIDREQSLGSMACSNSFLSMAVRIVGQLHASQSEYFFVPLFWCFYVYVRLLLPHPLILICNYKFIQAKSIFYIFFCFSYSLKKIFKV